MYFAVEVRHNIVQAIRRLDALSDDQRVLHTNLDSGTELSRIYRETGSIDSQYVFDDFERAKAFASISMDFVKKLIDHRAEQIERLESGDEFSA